MLGEDWTSVSTGALAMESEEREERENRWSRLKLARGRLTWGGAKYPVVWMQDDPDDVHRLA